MPEKQLTLNQQIALLPATVPDSILDFLEDMGQSAPLQTENARGAFDPEYLLQAGEGLRASIKALLTDNGKFVHLAVEPSGRDIPGGYLIRLTFENGVRGVGVVTRMKERTILKIVFQEGDYEEGALRSLMSK